MSITEFDKWKEALGKAVNIGENLGMSDNTINNINTYISLTSPVLITLFR